LSKDLACNLSLTGAPPPFFSVAAAAGAQAQNSLGGDKERRAER